MTPLSHITTVQTKNNRVPILTQYRRVIIAMIALIVGINTTTLEAQRPDAPEYGVRGDYAVGTMDVTLDDAERPLNVTIWYPAHEETDPEETVSYNLLMMFNVQGVATREANIADGSFPLVIFSHGSGGSRLLGLWLTEHLASHGFIVMATDHPGNNVEATVAGERNFAEDYAQRPLDILRVLDWAREANASDERLSNHIDTENVAVLGHSFGGYTALSVGGARLDTSKLISWCKTATSEESGADGVCFLRNMTEEIATSRGYAEVPDGAWDATTDEAIKAVIAYAPWNAPILSHETNDTPTLIIVGTSDSLTIPERDSYVMFEEMTQSERMLMTLALADHYIFVDICPPSLLAFGAFSSCSDAVWDMQRAHDIVNHYTTAYLRYHLMGDEGALGVFDAPLPRGLTLEQAQSE